MKTVCVDFDGVIAFYDGCKGINHFGEPIEGAREFLQALRSHGYNILIHTARCNVALNGFEVKSASSDNYLSKYVALRRLLLDYMKKYDLPFDDVHMGQGKPLADAYIDDRAVPCQPMKFPGAYEVALKDVLELSHHHSKVEKK